MIGQSMRGRARRAAALIMWMCGVATLSACVAVPQSTTSRNVEAGDASGNAPVVGTLPPPRGDLATASDETEGQRRARIRLELAGAYFGQGQATTALDEVKRALTFDPSSAAAYNLRGLIYASLNEPALAEDSFRRSLQLAPAEADTHHNYGWYLCRLRRYPESLAEFDAALAQPQARGQSKTLLARGVCQARAGDWVGAEKTLQRSYELDAANPATAVNLAEVLLRRGELERARFYVARVNAVPAFADAETLWLAARIEQRRGNRDGVEDLGAQLRKRYPTAPQTAAFEQGQFDDK